MGRAPFGLDCWSLWKDWRLLFLKHVPIRFCITASLRKNAYVRRIPIGIQEKKCRAKRGAKYRKEILPKYRKVRAKPKWKKLSRKHGSKNQHRAWAQLLWRSFGVMGFVCQHCGCLMRLRAVAIYPPATTKILRGLGVNLHGLGCTGPP